MPIYSRRWLHPLYVSISLLIGVLIYPDGGRYTAEWEDGLAVSGNYSFKDGLAYQLENWTYLAPSDRRFVKEVQEGFDPQWTVQQRMTKMPRGTYDTGNASPGMWRGCGERQFTLLRMLKPPLCLCSAQIGNAVTILLVCECKQ